MTKYTVKQVANLLKVNEETVRRWIRFGHLKSTQTCRKNGNVIDEQALSEFVMTRPKYMVLLNSTEAQNKRLNEVLIELISQRDQLNVRINQIQALLEEL